MAKFKIVVSTRSYQKPFDETDLYMLGNRIGANRRIGVQPNGGDTSTGKRGVYYVDRDPGAVNNIAEDIRKTLHFKVEVSDA
jgi:hypothetical protein